MGEKVLGLNFQDDVVILSTANYKALVRQCDKLDQFKEDLKKAMTIKPEVSNWQNRADIKIDAAVLRPLFEEKLAESEYAGQFTISQVDWNYELSISTLEPVKVKVEEQEVEDEIVDPDTVGEDI